MDDMSYIISEAMRRLTGMFGVLLAASIAQHWFDTERETVKAALGHEPTEEDWRYYRELKQELNNRQTACQTEIDREKLRRLVLGEDSGSNEAE